MSIKTRIQVRRGNLVDLPTLAAGEFGFTLDTFQLYVGDGSINHLISGANGNGGYPYNHLINGGFDFYQRSLTPASLSPYSDDAYCADRWYVLTQTGQIQYARTAGDTNSTWAGQIKNHQAYAQRMGIAQIVESINSIPLRGNTVRFQFRAKASATVAIRAAILEWTGTADVVTSDVVNDWTSTPTIGGFFLPASLAIVGVMDATNATTNYQDFVISGPVSVACNNLIVMIWTVPTVVQNTTLDITQSGLYVSDSAVAWSPRLITQELALCQRFCQLVDTTAITAVTNAVASSNLRLYGDIVFKSTMRAVPTLVASAVTWDPTCTAGLPAAGKIGAFNHSTGLYITASSTVAIQTNLACPFYGRLEFVATAGSFNSTAGQAADMRFATNVQAVFIAEL